MSGTPALHRGLASGLETSNTVGSVLSCFGRSWCTYILQTSTRLDALQILKNLESKVGKNHAQVCHLGRASLLIRIDHKLVDAQRGLALMEQALRDSTACVGDLDGNPHAGRLDSHLVDPHLISDPLDSWSEQTFDLPSIKAALHNQTLTQWILSRLIQTLKNQSTESPSTPNPNWRIIVSSKKDITHEPETLGNHFVPVDLSSKQAHELASKPAEHWRKLLQRLATSAQKSMDNLATSTLETNGSLNDRITLTSVGNLTKVEPTLKSFGITSLAMFPEKVSWCSSVITVYSLFDRLHVVFSGQNRLGDQFFSGLHAIDGGAS